MRRSKSCHPRIVVGPDRERPRSLDVVMAALSNSNGCGAQSPKAWQRVGEIREELLRTQLLLRPQARVILWKNHIYFGVWWMPSNPPLSILAPEKMHTTVLRVYADGDLQKFVPHLAHWSVALQACLHGAITR